LLFRVGPPDSTFNSPAEPQRWGVGGRVVGDCGGLQRIIRGVVAAFLDSIDGRRNNVRLYDRLAAGASDGKNSIDDW